MSDAGGPSVNHSPAPKVMQNANAKQDTHVAAPAGTSSAAAKASRIDEPQAPSASRRIDRLLTEYGQSHRNLANKFIHWLAVPVIAWCVLALAWSLPFPAALQVIPGLNWAWILAGLSIIYYLTLSVPLALGMSAFAGLSFFIIAACLKWSELPLWQLAIALFVVAWVFQFIGHKIEGRRPSFFKDLQFLLIGPAWLLAALFRLFAIRY